MGRAILIAVGRIWATLETYRSIRDALHCSSSRSAESAGEFGIGESGMVELLVGLNLAARRLTMWTRQIADAVTEPVAMTEVPLAMTKSMFSARGRDRSGPTGGEPMSRCRCPGVVLPKPSRAILPRATAASASKMGGRHRADMDTAFGIGRHIR